MGQCKLCKKKGLFLPLNQDGYCSSCERKQTAYYQEQKALERKWAKERRYFEKYKIAELPILNSVNYSVADKIPVYETFLKTYKFERSAHHHVLRLAELYAQNGQFEKAKGLLNEIYLFDISDPESEGHIRKVRYTQFLVENQWGHYLTAVQMLCAYYVLSSAYPASFLKKMRPIAKRAGLSPEQITLIDTTVRNYVELKNQDESSFFDDFRKILSLTNKTSDK